MSGRMYRRLFTLGILCLAWSTILLPLVPATTKIPTHSPVDKNLKAESKDPKGHLQPLGSHRPAEGLIRTVDGFLEPKEFYTNHVLASKPVLFKGAANDLPAFKLWSDTYLEKKLGSLKVDVEMGKKEDREGRTSAMTLKKFLQVYNQSDVYMVQDILPQMTDDLILPRPLQCGGFQDTLAVGVVWFSSGGTKSVLHSDDVDNINCILDGDKEIVFINKKFKNIVEDENFMKVNTYSKVDVEKVDLYKYPGFSQLRWWQARMEKGDCLFIPIHWYHTVASSKGRNLAVNLWFSHLAWFNDTDCKNCCSDNPSLSNVPIGDSVEQVRHNIFGLFEGMEYIRLEDAVEIWQNVFKHPSLVQEVFELIDQDKDLILSWEEIFSADLETLIRDFPELVGEDPEGQDIQHDEL